MPRGAGWKNEEAGLLEKMTQALNVYTAFKDFEERTITETEYAQRHFDLWRIVIDVEQMEKRMLQHG